VLTLAAEEKEEESERLFSVKDFGRDINDMEL
jgi:hypothetical protein